ncbi:MAG: peptidoglycan DD-metalloendopeptidase family protein [Gemmatimonadetes bacterium]|nr:M23 family metallopeptidase [Gemmatimonadota bacterium]NIR79595.1 M23 family metallopeptidase [Gemmatimonadota bacterium]NIT88125.1 M23 family metallopeptidase [Gemmatimonadota bacterium]NIU32090.1 M23 family metallopeptidase [Gemmatimonadota bacterium]NIU36562.1 peptidoglycan DD-metalloendopeptidase family protein [Gemmatimonadota bacterium]
MGGAIRTFSAWCRGRAGIAVLAVSAPILAALGWIAATRSPGDGTPPTRIEAYAQGLRAEDTPGAEAVEAWLAAARRALESPVPVSLPFDGNGWMSESELAAVGYRFGLREGQVVEVSVSVPSAARYFVELFRVPPDTAAEPLFVAEADSVDAALEHESRRDGAYVLRIVPEPFRGGRYSVEIARRAALPFPVAQRGPSSIISRYGAPRDGGRRSHEGVDIIAPRGTPVLAVTKALVHRVGRSENGGNYVWLQDWSRRKNLYYAHLERSWVDVGMVVEPGDGIGTVGNTGNASGPHLHFGIYDLDRRPSDPVPYITPPGAVRVADAKVAEPEE